MGFSLLNRINKLRFCILCALSMAGLFSGSHNLHAHEGASGIVKLRMDAMKEMGDLSKLTGKMIKAKVPMEFDVILDTANAFAQRSDELVSLFPDTDESRYGAKTEATEAIWAQWDEFTLAAEQFKVDSQQFLTVVNSINPSSSTDKPAMKRLKNSFLRAARNCRSCHKAFKVKKQ